MRRVTCRIISSFLGVKVLRERKEEKEERRGGGRGGCRRELAGIYLMKKKNTHKEVLPLYKIVPFNFVNVKMLIGVNSCDR